MEKPKDPVPLPDKDPLLLSDIVDNSKVNAADSFLVRTQLISLQQWLIETKAKFDK